MEKGVLQRVSASPECKVDGYERSNAFTVLRWKSELRVNRIRVSVLTSR